MSALGRLPFDGYADPDPHGQLTIGDEPQEWPRVNDARETVWACCESIIGPTCQHRVAP